MKGHRRMRSKIGPSLYIDLTREGPQVLTRSFEREPYRTFKSNILISNMEKLEAETEPIKSF